MKKKERKKWRKKGKMEANIEFRWKGEKKRKNKEEKE